MKSVSMCIVTFAYHTNLFSFSFSFFNACAYLLLILFSPFGFHVTSLQDLYLCDCSLLVSLGGFSVYSLPLDVFLRVPCLVTFSSFLSKIFLLQRPLDSPWHSCLPVLDVSALNSRLCLQLPLFCSHEERGCSACWALGVVLSVSHTLGSEACALPS